MADYVVLPDAVVLANLQDAAYAYDQFYQAVCDKIRQGINPKALKTMTTALYQKKYLYMLRLAQRCVNSVLLSVFFVPGQHVSPDTVEHVLNTTCSGYPIPPRIVTGTPWDYQNTWLSQLRGQLFVQCQPHKLSYAGC